MKRIGAFLLALFLQVLVLLRQLGQGEQLVHRAEAACEGAQQQRGGKKEQARFLHGKTLRGQDVSRSGAAEGPPGSGAEQQNIQRVSYHISLSFGMVICKFCVPGAGG